VLPKNCLVMPSELCPAFAWPAAVCVVAARAADEGATAATPTADAAARTRMPAPVRRGGFFVRQVFIFASFVRIEGFPSLGDAFSGPVGRPRWGPGGGQHAHALRSDCERKQRDCHAYLLTGLNFRDDWPSSMRTCTIRASRCRFTPACAGPYGGLEGAGQRATRQSYEIVIYRLLDTLRCEIASKDAPSGPRRRGSAQFGAAATAPGFRNAFEGRRTVMFLDEQPGIKREPAGVALPNSALPLGLDVANVTTADPGVQVENVSARGRRTRYQRVPGSLFRPGATTSRSCRNVAPAGQDRDLARPGPLAATRACLPASRSR
jgi:hypothetical protein